jgi:hypothetical protein
MSTAASLRFLLILLRILDVATVETFTIFCDRDHNRDRDHDRDREDMLGHACGHCQGRDVPSARAPDCGK